MNACERFCCLLSADEPRQADAIVVLEGDGLVRLVHGCRLYYQHWAPLLVLSGGRDEPPECVPARLMAKRLIAVPQQAVILEDASQHTRDQAVNVVALAQEHRWAQLLLVASHYHQYRAFLTFLRAAEEAGMDRQLQLVSAPVRDLPWFVYTPWGRRLDFLEREFDRIESYQAVGHVASYEDGIDYLRWREGTR